MGKIIVPNAVERRKGFLYYIDGEGNLCEAQMAYAKKKNVEKETIFAKSARVLRITLLLSWVK